MIQQVKCKVGDVAKIIKATEFGTKGHVNDLPSWLKIGDTFVVTDISTHKYTDGTMGYIYYTNKKQDDDTYKSGWWFLEGNIEPINSSYQLNDLPLFKGDVND